MKLKTSPHLTDAMTATEKRASAMVGLIMSIRMLGLFMILPVFTLFAHNYLYATEALIGFALGIYGLTQALLQIPFGLASDIWGRKRIILLGLSIFILGSILASQSDSIYMVILGRALQGAGAVGSVLLALLSDLTRPQHRAKGMAIVGLSIGVSFSLALFLGSFSTQWLNLSGLFWLTACLAGIGMLLVWYALPNVPLTQTALSQEWAGEHWQARLWSVLKNTELLKCAISIFFLHTMLTALFVGMPVVLEILVNSGFIEAAWQVYLPVLIASLLSALPIIFFAEKFQQLKVALMAGVIIILVSLLTLWEINTTLFGCYLGLWLFFTGFNCLEALLPSIVSRIAPKNAKGTAMSFYTCAQFLGIFVGGSLGGWIYSSSYLNDIFLSLAALATIWLAIVYNMDPPRSLSGFQLHLSPEHLLDTAYLHKKLSRIAGIEDVRIDVTTGVAYLSIDVNFFDARQVKIFETES